MLKLAHPLFVYDQYGVYGLMQPFLCQTRQERYTASRKPIFMPWDTRKRGEKGRFAPFRHFCSHFLDVEGHGEEGKIHCDLVFAEVAESLVLHVVLYLPENRLWFYRAFRPMFESLL